MADPTSSAIVRVENPESGGGEKGKGYTRGIWTLDETLVLLDAKKLDDERRMRGGDKERGKTAELRWKWVENYCSKNNCIRSQNQCNDKWDNLLRDYKKVREYENKLGPDQPSYWHLEKHERKERGLPSNLQYQVYERLHEVVDKRYAPRILPGNSSGMGNLGMPQQQQQQQFILPSPLPPQQQQQQQQQQPPLPPPQPSQQEFPVHQQQRPTSGGYSAEISDSSESDGSEVPQSSAKRRRVSRSTHGLAPAMAESTAQLTQTLMACEEKKDKRHMDILGVEEKKLQLEETKIEISREGLTGLIGAVNNLASAILTLASDKTVATE